MSVAYAVCNSQIAVDMMGRVGPGGPNSLLKQWLKQNVGEPASVPDGVVNKVFDNEQRLVKNYLTRGDGKVTLDVFTNILAMKMPLPPDLNQRADFKTCNWHLPTRVDMLSALSVPTADCHPKAAKLLGRY